MSILESGTMDKTALKLARKARKRLLDEDVEWGIVEKGSDSNAGKYSHAILGPIADASGGRCVACAKRKQDCVVQLGQPSARGGPFEIISRYAILPIREVRTDNAKLYSVYCLGITM